MIELPQNGTRLHPWKVLGGGASSLTCLLLASAALSVGQAGNPEPPPQPAKSPTKQELRPSVNRGLEYLAKEGDQWMADKNCNSCHHLPMLLWSHREAGQRGLAVDSERFDTWLAWAVERVESKNPGVEEAALLMLAMPERPAPHLGKFLTEAQQPDGSWKPAGQFATMQKRGIPDARANTTRLSLLALAAAQMEPDQLESAHTRAVETLKKQTKPTSLESLAFRILFARRLGTAEEVKSLTEELLKHQRGDGGWSFVIGANKSDPLATGQALYVLQDSAGNPPAAAIDRGRRWLLTTQQDDGSWPIDITHISQVDRSGSAKAKSFQETTALYTYWGTAWATLGLMQGLPVKP